MPYEPTPISKFPVTIPRELHRAFKAHCALKGVRMTDVIRELVARECATIQAPDTKRKPPAARKTVQLEAAE